MKRFYILTLLLMLVVTVGTTAAQQQRDSDGDGLPDATDRCPSVAGPRDNGGCPIFQVAPTQAPDSDGDGLPDANDQCPSVAGPRDNGGCPIFQVAPTQAPDSDGDGLPDTDDQCPNAAGPRDNRGCPLPAPTDAPSNNDDVPDQPPNDAPLPGEGPSNEDEFVPAPLDPTVPAPPPFQPPALPDGACYVTPASASWINVRQLATMGAPILGRLQPGLVYEAIGYVVSDDEVWFVLNNYEGFAGALGYSAGFVLLTTDDCSQIAPPLVSNSSADNLAANTANPSTAEYDVDDWDIWLMDKVCGEDNWGYILDDDGLVGYYCLDYVGAAYEPNDAVRVGDPTSDCDENGVEDGIEFNPPDCFIAPDFDDNTPSPAAAVELDDDQRRFMNEQCPGGWTVHEATTEDGDKVLQGQCDDPVATQNSVDNDIMDDLLWTVCPNGWSTGNDGSFQCEDNIIDEESAAVDDDIMDDLLWTVCPNGWSTGNDGSFQCEDNIIDEESAAADSGSGIGDGDCNENGIRDRDELLPPDCLVSPDTDGNSN